MTRFLVSGRELYGSPGQHAGVRPVEVWVTADSLDEAMAQLHQMHAAITVDSVLQYGEDGMISQEHQAMGQYCEACGSNIFVGDAYEYDTLTGAYLCKDHLTSKDD